MNIKYWGKEWEKGLSLTADLFDNEGNLVHSGFILTETVAGSSAIYRSASIFDTLAPLSTGMYVVRIQDSQGRFLDCRELAFNGVKEVTPLEFKFWSEENQMEFRDALGLTGAKKVATGGQLQKKSEAPHNEIVDTNILK